LEFSTAGLVGAVIGTVIGVINYAVVVGFVQMRLRKLDRSQTSAEREEFERKLALMRRIVLALDIVVFSALGYWLGRTVGG
jgi:predicted DNA-binding transcriptional regulator